MILETSDLIPILFSNIDNISGIYWKGLYAKRWNIYLFGKTTVSSVLIEHTHISSYIIALEPTRKRRTPTTNDQSLRFILRQRSGNRMNFLVKHVQCLIGFVIRKDVRRILLLSDELGGILARKYSYHWRRLVFFSILAESGFDSCKRTIPGGWGNTVRGFSIGEAATHEAGPIRAA